LFAFRHGGSLVHMMEIVERYVAMWNEPDAERRRAAVRELWAADAMHVLRPPREMRETADGLGFPDVLLESHGHDALVYRVERAYEEFVAPGTFVFRHRGDADRLRDVVTFHWEMVARDSGEVAGSGLEVLVLAADGRIAADYQFVAA
jgi:hypothetical protein